MSDDTMINSMVYWNHRFANDWESYEGPRQSRFFSQLAIEHLPRWLLDQIKRQSLTLADWGCAQGDGTEVWASYVVAGKLSGIDFSSAAIEQAIQRYPAIRFIHEDWLAEDGGPEEAFDIVFSSNTLEHFHKPYDVLHAICSRAKKAVVLALPYKELERIDEHFFSFLPENIPSVLTNGFRLIWSQVVDCRSLPNTLWGGHQIILVYADPKWMDSLNLTLNDYCIEQSDTVTEIDRLNTIMIERDEQVTFLNQAMTEQKQQMNSLNRLLAECNEQITSLNQTMAKHNGEIANLNQTLIDRDRQIDLLNQAVTEQKQQMNSLKQDLRETVRLLNLTQKMCAYPMRYSIKKNMRKIAKVIYHALPISFESKQRIRVKVTRWLRSPLIVRTKPTEGGSAAQYSAPQVIQHELRRTSSILRALVEGGSLREYDIFVFSVIDWHFRMQRPQQLARSFAKTGRRVFFFSNHFVDSDRPGYDIEQLDPTLQLYQIKLNVRKAPAIYFDPPAADALAMIEQGVAKLIMDFAAISSVSLIQHAYWYPVATRLPNTLRVYDCMDHHEGFGNVPVGLIELEKNMLRESDLVITTSAWLESVAYEYNHNVALIRNAVEYEHFSKPPTEHYRDVQGRKIIGYYGAIAEWFDLDLIRAIATHQPTSLVLLVGNDTIEAGTALKDLSNVVFIGEVPYVRLPYYLHAFDVCLLPFRVIPLTLATNPVKVYEYLAAGKPVVCVDLPEISQFGDLVYRAHTREEFVQMVFNCIMSPNDESASHLRRQFASEQTWEHRVKALTQAIHDIPLPKVSVVVLTYNNLDLTKSCLDNLLRWSDYPNMEIIVVDNASTDGSINYLREFQRQHPEVRLLLNDKNLGFAAGNNVGLAAATGDYLVILNNDTVVTPGWLLTMVRHLQADPDIGLVGPVTNNIGNEAKINVEYSNLEEMLLLSMSYTTKHMGRHIRLRTAAFFCVMMPRKVFERVGLLDENFGRGFFEDDDYCRRIENLGLRVVCAEDVFVHHYLSAAFNKLGSVEKQELFEKNRVYYESKWGKWEPHVYRD